MPSEKGTPLLGYWSAVDDLLSVVQMLLDEMIAKNSDEAIRTSRFRDAITSSQPVATLTQT